jgi:acetyltransferase-like isoleucine patch superfamily enzyme
MKVDKSATIGDGAKIGEDCVIRKNAEIGDNAIVFPHTFIGEGTIIGEGTVVQYGAFIEHHCKIGCHSRIGTNAVLRRETNIGDHSIFGSLSASEGRNWIGDHVLIHSQCHLTTGILIEDWVFIAPMFVGANDPKMLHGRRQTERFLPKGPHIKFGSGIAVNVTLLPGITVGRECIIGASSLVTKDVPDFSIAFGVPARAVKSVDDSWRLPEAWYGDFRKRVSEEQLARILNRLLDDYK